MLRITKLKMSLIVVAAVMLSACGTMQANKGLNRLPEEIGVGRVPLQPPEGVALLEPKHVQDFLGTASVGEVDGQNLASTEHKVEMSPGEHTVKIYVTSGFGAQQLVSSKTLMLNAKASHSYRVNGTIIDGYPYAWITDDKDGHVVAGKKPE